MHTSCYTLARMATKAERLLKKARKLVSKGKTAKALATYRDACEHGPHDPEAWIERANVAQSVDETAEAADALFQAADLYARGGLTTEAAEMAEKVLELDPKHGPAKRFVRMLKPPEPEPEPEKKPGQSPQPKKKRKRKRKKKKT